MVIYGAYEQLTPFYDNVSGTGKKKLSRSGHTMFNVFYYIANCFWEVLIVSSGKQCIYMLQYREGLSINHPIVSMGTCYGRAGLSLAGFEYR